MSNILVVDDSSDIRELIKNILLKYEFENIVLAESAENAIDLLNARENQKQFDLILMDVQMPEMDGYEATRKIRDMPDTHKRETPIIAMTAHAMSIDREKSLKEGMNAYISKPFVPNELLRILSQSLQKEITGQSQQKVDNQGLPDQILGIHLSQGLQRIGGNLPRYLNILNTFSDEIIDLVEDPTPYHIHKLKGSSSSIGAMKIMALCQRIEQERKKGNHPREEIKQLSDEMAQVRRSIGNILQQMHLNKETGFPDQQEGNQRTLNEMLTQLEDMLKNDLFIEVDFSLQIKELLPEETQITRSFKKVIESVEAFDYDTARTILVDIEQRQSLN